MTPKPGQIYRSPDGQPMFYVRTEKHSGAAEPEHLFATVRNRMICSRWMGEVPPELELVVDTEGQRRANEESWLRLVAEYERDLAFRLLKQACTWLPRERADELRRQWSERQPPEVGE